MLTASAKQKTRGDLLRQILLTYLETSRVIGWPGTDGLTEDDILDYYPQASVKGKVPDKQELCRRHMELIAEIQSFFAPKGCLENHDSL
jgi:hypothetical protein